jgi:hypothetical protein
VRSLVLVFLGFLAKLGLGICFTGELMGLLVGLVAGVDFGSFVTLAVIVWVYNADELVLLAVLTRDLAFASI